ncbi:MAG: hypothetical protein FWE53_02920 [Firmicutes bacterium]|nr:hypothetical protein [Bacillota bacterium]
MNKEKEILKELKADFESRKKERKPYEQAWLLNMSFLQGNQYAGLTSRGEIGDLFRQYFWQEREVYNHIAPIVETRLAKLARVRPSMAVLPASGSTDDINTAKVSKKVLDAATARINISQVVSEATKWSEVCGTSFYKVIWNKDAGALIGKTDAADIYEGDVEVAVCSPFEIYPDSGSAGNVDSCISIIHARTYHIDTIKNIWGVEVKSENSHAVVLEKYIRPSGEYPDGRLLVAAGDKLLYDGELPYKNGKSGERCFPFIRQVAIESPNLFWGTSIIERCIPVQRAYNAVKNRKHEFLNRITMGVLTVEDGSVDIENLEEEGLSPGKVLVYRQGSHPPRMLSSENVPVDFTYEEERLLNEFNLVSGVSDLLHNNAARLSNMSGIALQLLIEQEDARISASGESIRFAVLKISQNILLLYKQFAGTRRIAQTIGKNGEVQQFYWNKSDINSADVVFETENEFGQTPAQKRSMVFDLLKAGLLHNEDGRLSNTMRLKVLDLLGFGIWENAHDLSDLQRTNAENENLKLLNYDTNPKVLEIHDHDIHISEHTAFMLTKEFVNITEARPELTEVVLEHIREHKKFKSLENETIKEQN